MSNEDEWTDIDETTTMDTDWSSSDPIIDDAPPLSQGESGDNTEPCEDYVEVRGVSADGKRMIIRVSSSQSSLGGRQ